MNTNKAIVILARAILFILKYARWDTHVTTGEVNHHEREIEGAIRFL